MRKRVLALVDGTIASFTNTLLLQKQFEEVQVVSFTLDNEYRDYCSATVAKENRPYLESFVQKFGLSDWAEISLDEIFETRFVDPALAARVRVHAEESLKCFYQDCVIPWMNDRCKSLADTYWSLPLFIHSNPLGSGLENHLDYSVLLSQVHPDQLEKMVTPLGDLTLDQTRQLWKPFAEAGQKTVEMNEAAPSKVPGSVFTADFWNSGVLHDKISGKWTLPGPVKSPDEIVTTEHPGPLNLQFGQPLEGSTPPKLVSGYVFSTRTVSADPREEVYGTEKERVLYLSQTNYFKKLSPKGVEMVDLKSIYGHAEKCRMTPYHFSTARVEGLIPLAMIPPKATIGLYQSGECVGSGILSDHALLDSNTGL